MGTPTVTSTWKPHAGMAARFPLPSGSITGHVPEHGRDAGAGKQPELGKQPTRVALPVQIPPPSPPPPSSPAHLAGQV